MRSYGRGAVGAAVGMALLWTGCAGDETGKATVDPGAAVATVPSSSPPTLGGATSGRAASASYTLTFSLGGDVPPMRGEGHRLNVPSGEE